MSRADCFFTLGVSDARRGEEQEQVFAYHADGENYRLGYARGVELEARG